MLLAVGNADNALSARILEIQVGMAIADRRETYRDEDQFRCGGIFSCNEGSAKSTGACA